MRTDYDILKDIAAGSEVSLRELIQKYQTPLKIYCASILSSPDDVDEVIHDTFVRFWINYARKHKAIDSLKSLLYRIARNAAYDKCRADRLVSCGGFLNIAMADNKTPVDVLNEKRVDEYLEKLFKQISVKDREILELFYIEAFRMEEVAQILSLNVEAVNSRLRRARERVRTLLPNNFLQEWSRAHEA